MWSANTRQKDEFCHQDKVQHSSHSLLHVVPSAMDMWHVYGTLWQSSLRHSFAMDTHYWRISYDDVMPGVYVVKVSTQWLATLSDSQISHITDTEMMGHLQFFVVRKCNISGYGLARMHLIRSPKHTFTRSFLFGTPQCRFFRATSVVQVSV